jgi:hypothetical protein
MASGLSNGISSYPVSDASLLDWFQRELCLPPGSETIFQKAEVRVRWQTRQDMGIREDVVGRVQYNDCFGRNPSREIRYTCADRKKRSRNDVSESLNVRCATKIKDNEPLRTEYKQSRQLMIGDQGEIR